MQTKISHIMDIPAIEFSLFKELPKSIRLQIWTYAASVSRTVELHEEYSTGVRVGEGGRKDYHTSIRSRTRQPALLQACAEAKRVALGVFIPMYKHAHSNNGIYSAVYVNPITDITYRGLDSEPFRLFGPNHRKDIVPLGATRTLAVNSSILCNDPTKPFRANIRWNENEVSRLADGSKKSSPADIRRKEDELSIPQQIMACANHGLKVLIFVAGNNQDHAEFELEEVDDSFILMQDLLLRAENLRAALHHCRHELIEQGSIECTEPPTVKVMKIKSRSQPIPAFQQFSRLPQELQNAVWDYASDTRRVITVERMTPIYRENKISHRCQPPLLSVCRASRTIAMKKLTRIPWTSGAKPGYYNKSIDVVIIPRFDRDPAAFSDWEISYIGIPLRGLQLRDSHFLQRMRGVKKVIITVGECHPKSEVTLVPIKEPYEIGKDGVTKFSGMYCHARDKVHSMTTQLRKVATKWEREQEKKAENGEPRGAEWNVPVVKAARVRAVCRVASPYSYDVETRSEEGWICKGYWGS